MPQMLLHKFQLQMICTGYDGGTNFLWDTSFEPITAKNIILLTYERWNFTLELNYI